MPGNARVVITGKDKTQAAIDGSISGLNKLRGSYVKLAGVVGAVVVSGAIAKMVSKTLEVNDALAKNADRIGITTRALAGLQHAGELTGVSTEAMVKSVQRFNRSIGDTIAGTGEAAKEFEQLGLDAAALAELPADEAMAQVADAMMSVESQAERTRIAMNLFGRSGANLLTTLAGGGDVLREMVREAEALGIALSRTDAAKIEQANDSILRMQQVFQGAANRFTVEFAPAITAVTNALVENADNVKVVTDAMIDLGKGAVETVLLTVEGGLKGIAGMADFFSGIAEDIDLAFETHLQPILEKLGVIEEEAVSAAHIVEQAWFMAADGTRSTLVTLDNGMKITATSAEDLEKQLSEINQDLSDFQEKAEPPSSLTAAIELIEDLRQKFQAATQGGGEGVEPPPPPPAAATVTALEDMLHPTDEELAAHEARLQSSVLAIQESFLTETEAIQVQHETRQAMLDEALQRKLVSEEQYAVASENVEKSRQAALDKISKAEMVRAAQEKASNQQRVASAVGSLASILEASGKHNKAMLAAAKAIRIAEAIINTYAGANLALATIPPPFGFVVAGSIIAAGIANVATIAGTSAGGGASAGGGGGGGAITAPPLGGTTAPPELPAAAAAQEERRTPTLVSLNVSGHSFSVEQLREIVDGLNEQHEDGYKLTVAGG